MMSTLATFKSDLDNDDDDNDESYTYKKNLKYEAEFKYRNEQI